MAAAAEVARPALLKALRDKKTSEEALLAQRHPPAPAFEIKLSRGTRETRLGAGGCCLLVSEWPMRAGLQLLSYLRRPCLRVARAADESRLFFVFRCCCGSLSTIWMPFGHL